MMSVTVGISNDKVKVKFARCAQLMPLDMFCFAVYIEVELNMKTEVDLSDGLVRSEVFCISCQ